MSKIIRSMLRAPDLEKSFKFCAECSDLLPTHRLASPSFSLVHLRNAEKYTGIELNLKKGRTEPHGDGYGHVGVGVPDAAADRVRLVSQVGLRYSPLDIKEAKADDNGLIARYFFIQDPDGYKVEALERHGHYQ